MIWGIKRFPEIETELTQTVNREIPVIEVHTLYGGLTIPLDVGFTAGVN